MKAFHPVSKTTSAEEKVSPKTFPECVGKPRAPMLVTGNVFKNIPGKVVPLKNPISRNLLLIRLAPLPVTPPAASREVSQMGRTLVRRPPRKLRLPPGLILLVSLIQRVNLLRRNVNIGLTTTFVCSVVKKGTVLRECTSAKASSAKCRAAVTAPEAPPLEKNKE